MRLGMLTNKIPLHMKRAFYDNCPIEIEGKVYDKEHPNDCIYLVKVHNVEENTEKGYLDLFNNEAYESYSDKTLADYRVNDEKHSSLYIFIASSYFVFIDNSGETAKHVLERWED